MKLILLGLETVSIAIAFPEVLLTVTVFIEKNIPLYPRGTIFSAYTISSLVAWHVRVFAAATVAVSTQFTMNPSHTSPLVPVDVVLEGSERKSVSGG